MNEINKLILQANIAKRVIENTKKDIEKLKNINNPHLVATGTALTIISNTWNAYFEIRFGISWELYYVLMMLLGFWRKKRK